MKYNSLEEIVKDLEGNPVEAGGNIYHPIPFSEFSHLETSTSKAGVYKKWGFVQRALKDFYPDGLGNLRVLDIGANAGFYTFSLAKEGAKVTSFEPHPRYAPIGGFLVTEKRLDVNWHGVAFNPELVKGMNFDVALMLSVFQWMSEGGSRMSEASRELRMISGMSRCLIFEMGFNKGKSCIRTSKFNHYAEHIRFLKGNTAYNHFKLLGTTRIWSNSRRYLILCSHVGRFEDSLFRRIMREIRI